MPAIEFDLEVYQGFSGPARNRLLRSRILNRLRGIKRQHPALNYQVQRGDNFIRVVFSSQESYTMFALLWPANYIRWEEKNDIS